jgi:hypothetical protein
MWLLTNFGAFMPALRPAHTIEEGDEQVLQIRARRRVDLDRLRTHYMPDLGGTYTVPKADYQYRANCTRASLASALVRISLDIDYVSFKDTTVTTWGDHVLHDAYMAVWRTLFTHLGPRRQRRRTVPQDDLWMGWDAWEAARPKQDPPARKRRGRRAQGGDGA